MKSIMPSARVSNWSLFVHPFCCLIAAASLAPCAMALASGTPLRPGFPSDTVPASMSADGSIVAVVVPGYYNPPFSQAPSGLLWKASAGFDEFTSPFESREPLRHAMSDDGSFIAGRHYGRMDTHGAFVWHSGAVLYPPDNSSYGRGLALTADGSTLVWADNDSSYGLYLWDGVLQTKISDRTPYGASIADDASVVAFASLEDDTFQRWTQSGGLAQLPSPPGMVWPASYDVLMNSDGSVIYGLARLSDSVALVRWNASGPVIAPPDQLGAVPLTMGMAIIAGVSADGRTIAFSDGVDSYIWTEQEGVRRFEAFLAAHDITFGPHGHIQALCMNPAATVFAGIEDSLYAYNPSSFWYLDLNNAPAFCPADANYDRLVDDQDFVPFAEGYDRLDCADPDMPLACPSDLNRDGLVDDADFVIFFGSYDALLCP